MATLVTTQRSTLANRISWGAFALFLAALASTIQMILSIYSSSNPHTDQVQVALEAATFAYRVRMELSILYLIFFMLGVLALYAYLSHTKAEKLAFAGLVVSMVCIALFLPLIGFAAYVFPAIGNLVAQGREEMVAVMDETFREPFVAVAYLFGGLLWNIGPILIGAAIWRSGSLWKWGGLLLIIQGVLGFILAIPASVMDDAPLWVKMIPNIAGVIGQIALAISLFQTARNGVEPRREA